MMKAVSPTPSLIAITVAVPIPIPLTSPLVSTVATVGAALVQLIRRRPKTGAPVESRSTADNCNVRSTATVADSGVNVREATGSSGAPFALNVTRSAPGRPGAVAAAVCAPAVGPRVLRARAYPDGAVVVSRAGAIDPPPPVTAQSIGTPAAPLP